MLVVHYRGRPEAALRDVSLQARRGRVTAVAGPNGSGKSTLVRVLVGAQPIASGSIEIDGIDARRLGRLERARKIAVITQREEPVFALPVREYVALGRYPHEGPWRGATAEDESAVGVAIEQAELGALADRSTQQLSGGEWQRVRLARALAQGGDALVLDEPTTFLDIAHEMAMFELFAAIARAGRAVLLVSHQLNLVARFADDLVLLHRGLVVASGTPADVMQAHTLEQVYDWPVVVTRDPAHAGVPSLIPLRRPRSEAAQ